MTPLIPDTLQGALILSLIDFLLSFVVISFIGILLAGFPLLNRVAAWLTSLRPTAPVKMTTPTPAPADQEIPAEDVAAIVAAVSAVMGGEHHILHIGPSPSSGEWLAAGRQAQHLSHLPPRNVKR
jgi:hypothetical protein